MWRLFEPRWTNCMRIYRKRDKQLYFRRRFREVKQIARKWLKKDTKGDFECKSGEPVAKSGDKGKKELVQRASKVIQTMHV